MNDLQIDRILKNEALSRKLINKMASLYGIDATVHRVIELDPSTGKKDEILEAYGIETTAYRTSSDKNTHTKVKLLVAQEQLQSAYNGSIINLLLITGVESQLRIGDQVEFSINNKRIIYYIKDPPETFYGTYHRVSLTPQMSVEDGTDVQNN